MTTILLLGGCQTVTGTQSDNASESQGEEISWAQKYDSEDTGILVGIDEDEQTITVKKVDSGEKIELNFTGATNVTDKYESVLVIKQVPIGELVNIYYSKDDSTVKKVEISPDAWEYTQVQNLTFDQTEKMIDIAGVKYRYGDSFTLISNEQEGNLLDLNSLDIVTVKGINKRICSIIVTTGHGYISLENDETFLDGWIDVGQESAKPITKDMLVVATEGNHKVTVAKDGAGGTKNVTVKRNEKTVVDVSDLKSETPKSGSLKFTITPSSASLYIDGVKQDYSELIVVDYGAHRVVVKADGHSDYSQTIVVGSSYAEIEINADGATNSGSSSTSGASGSTNDTSTSTNNTSGTNNNNNNTGTVDGQKGLDLPGLDNIGGSSNTGTNNTGTNDNSNEDSMGQGTKGLSSGEAVTDALTEVLKGVLSN
jgi:hypothetical protein